MRFLLVSLLVFAFASSAQASERARALLVLIGFDVAAASQSRTFEELPNEVGASLSSDVARDWSRAGEGLFRADELMDIAAQSVGDALTDEQVGALALHYSSAEALGITELEKRAQDPDRRDAVEAEQDAYIAGLDERFRVRFETISALMAAMDVVESGTAMAMNINFALMSGMAASDALPRSFTQEELLALVQMQRDTIRVAVQNSVLESMAYTYRDLSDEDLADYSAFLATPDARALYEAINQATEALVTRDARILGQRITDMSAEREL